MRLVSIRHYVLVRKEVSRSQSWKLLQSESPYLILSTEEGKRCYEVFKSNLSQLVPSRSGTMARKLSKLSFKCSFCPLRIQGGQGVLGERARPEGGGGRGDWSSRARGSNGGRGIGRGVFCWGCRFGGGCGDVLDCMIKYRNTTKESGKYKQAGTNLKLPTNSASSLQGEAWLRVSDAECFSAIICPVTFQES